MEALFSKSSQLKIFAFPDSFLIIAPFFAMLSDIVESLIMKSLEALLLNIISPFSFMMFFIDSTCIVYSVGFSPQFRGTVGWVLLCFRQL